MHQYQVEAIKNGVIIMSTKVNANQLADVTAKMSNLVSKQELRDDPNMTFSINAKIII